MKLIAPADVVWEDPDVSARASVRFAAFWAELRENPGRWARYPGRGNIGTIVRGRKDRDSIECASRMIDGNRVGFARWIGGSK